MSDFNLASFYQSTFEDHASLLPKTQEACAADFEKLVDAAVNSIQQGGKIVFFGNGGSAADAQHLATELAVRYSRERAPIAALALTTDTSNLTACGNDYGYDYVFERQVMALCKKEDLLLGISTSGNSPNVLRALEYGKSQGMICAGLSGKDGGKMSGLADPHIIVPSKVTARIQEMHILFGHMLCEALEERLGLIA